MRAHRTIFRRLCFRSLCCGLSIVCIAPEVFRADARAIASVPTHDDGVLVLTYEDDAVVARAFDTSLTWKDLDPLLRNRHAMSKDGRAALRHLVESRALEILAKERGVVVPDDSVEARSRELDAAIKASGEKEGIESSLKKAKLTRDEFRHYLRLAIVQETLTRRALGLEDKAPVTGEQQEMWMDETLKERQYAELPPPWKDGVAARCSDFEIGLVEFLRYMRRHLPEQDLRDDCYQVLLLKRMLLRMPDLAPEKLDQYVQDELKRRRDDVNADPRYKGVPYEKLLSTQGIVVTSLPDDPSIRVAALARLWVDRSYNDETLKRVYADEREHFDSLYGEAIDTYMLLLHGAEFTHDKSQRTFHDADAQLEELKPRIASLEDFLRIAKERNEDAPTREGGGSLGYVSAGNPRIPAIVRETVKGAIRRSPAGTKPSATAGEHLVGPVRLPNGSALLWLGARRPAPAWESMAVQVHRELRKRFVDEVLQKTGMVTVFDGR